MFHPLADHLLEAHLLQEDLPVAHLLDLPYLPQPGLVFCRPDLELDPDKRIKSPSRFGRARHR